MKAIILVAGKGTRLKPLTEKTHKCLTEVNGTPILKNALCKLKKVGVDEVILVVGYMKNQIMERIGFSYEGMKISYAVNDDYEITNTSASLLKGLELLEQKDDLFLLEGDVFFEYSILENLMKKDKEACTVLERYNPKLDGTFVELNEDGVIVDWIHKSVRSDSFVVRDKYKTVNIHFFKNMFVKDVLLPQTRESVENSEGKEPIEYIMRRIVQHGLSTIFPLILLGEKWFEIDDINDLKIAEKIFR